MRGSRRATTTFVLCYYYGYGGIGSKIANGIAHNIILIVSVGDGKGG